MLVGLPETIIEQTLSLSLSVTLACSSFINMSLSTDIESSLRMSKLNRGDHYKL